MPAYLIKSFHFTLLCFQFFPEVNQFQQITTLRLLLPQLAYALYRCSNLSVQLWPHVGRFSLNLTDQANLPTQRSGILSLISLAAECLCHIYFDSIYSKLSVAPSQDSPIPWL